MRFRQHQTAQSNVLSARDGPCEWTYLQPYESVAYTWEEPSMANLVDVEVGLEKEQLDQSSLGRLEASVWFEYDSRPLASDAEFGLLHVMLRRAELMPESGRSVGRTHVNLSVLPRQKNSLQQKSHEVDGSNLNPEWHQFFSFPLAQSLLAYRKLELAVHDSKRGGVLGKATLDLGEVFQIDRAMGPKERRDSMLRMLREADYGRAVKAEDSNALNRALTTLKRTTTTLEGGTKKLTSGLKKNMTTVGKTLTFGLGKKFKKSSAVDDDDDDTDAGLSDERMEEHQALGAGVCVCLSVGPLYHRNCSVVQGESVNSRYSPMEFERVFFFLLTRTPFPQSTRHG